MVTLIGLDQANQIVFASDGVLDSYRLSADYHGLHFFKWVTQPVQLSRGIMRADKLLDKHTDKLGFGGPKNFSRNGALHGLLNPHWTSRA